MEPDKSLRRRLLEFEIGLDLAVAEETSEHEWGRALLNPSVPLIWDASWLAVEGTGLPAAELVDLGDRVLGGAGFEHRTIVACDEADGRRLCGEFEALASWEVERTLYMVWRDELAAPPPVPVRETRLAEIEPLRRDLIRESLLPGIRRKEETLDQILETERRLGAAGGDRWFVAPSGLEPAAACRLLAGDGIRQVEDVATAEGARGRGLAKSVVLAALAEALGAEPEVVFLTADAADWPQLMYAKLGFEPIGELHVFRRRPGKP